MVGSNYSTVHEQSNKRGREKEEEGTKQMRNLLVVCLRAPVLKEATKSEMCMLQRLNM